MFYTSIKYLRMHSKLRVPKPSSKSSNRSPGTKLPSLKSPALNNRSSSSSKSALAVVKSTTSSKANNTPSIKNNSDQKLQGSDSTTNVTQQSMITDKSPVNLASLNLPNQSSPDYGPIFDAKVDTCYRMPDFYDPNDFEIVKLKSQVMSNFVDYLEMPNVDISQENQLKLFKAIMFNIERPIIPLPVEKFYIEDIIVPQDKSLIHIASAYAMMIKLHSLNPNAPFFDRGLMKKLTQNLKSPDATERDFIIIFFIRYFKEYPDSFPETFNYWMTCIDDFIITKSTPTQIWSIMKTLNDLLLSMKHVQYQSAFEQSIVPLVHHDFFCYFDVQFSEMAELYPTSTPLILDKMFSHWPHQSVNKTISYIMTIAGLLPHSGSRMREFVIKYFKKVAECIKTNSPKLCIASLHTLLGAPIEKIIETFGDDVLPLFLPAVRWSAENHWSDEVVSTANTILDYFKRVGDPSANQIIDNPPHQVENNDEKKENWRKLFAVAESSAGVDGETFEKSLEMLDYKLL